MKNRVISLYSALLNVHYGWSASKYYYFKKRQRTWEPIVLTLALAPALIGFISFLWLMAEKLFLGGLAFGQPHLALVYGALLVAVSGLFFGFLYIISAFYFSSDLEILLSWPLKSWEILMAKFGVVLTGQYLINSFILLPLWLRYGLLAGEGLSYVLSAVVVFFTLPILPLVIASLLTILIMRFTNLSKYKDRLTLIGGILFVVLILGLQFWLQSSGGEDPELFLNKILTETDGLVKVAGRVFPTSIWAAKAMAYSKTAAGWGNLCLLFLASGASLVLLYFLGEKVFLQGLVSGLERTKGGTQRAVNLTTERSRLSLVTLTATEIKLFIRDPNFALNGLIGYVLLPVFAVLPLFSSNVAGNPLAFLAEIALPGPLVIGIIAVFFMLMTALSMIPATTFSREGKYLWIIRSLPLSIQQIILPRVWASQVINTLGCLLGLLPLAYLFNWGLLPLVAGSLLGILLSVPLSTLLILLDLRRPMLDWVNPIKAVKSNLNAMIGLVGAGLLVFILGYSFYWFYKTTRLWLIFPLLGTLFVLLSAFAIFLLLNYAPKRWREIEGGLN